MKLNEYLDKNNETPMQFAKRGFLCFNTVKKVFVGSKVKRFVAKRVVRATKGVVTMGDINIYDEGDYNLD